MTIDYKGFIENNFLIKDKTGVIVPFVFNETQNFYYDLMIKEYGEELQGVRENILKFRQPGFSSLIDAIFTVDFIFSEEKKIPIIDADIVSAREKDTIVLFNRVSGFLDSWLNKVGKLRKDFLEIDSTTLMKGYTGAQIYVQTASAKVSGRGGTKQNIHWCLAPGQLVIGKDGFVYPIESSPKIVRDGLGRLIKVHSLSIKEAPEKLKSIKLFGNTPFPINGTLSHKLLCLGNDGKPVFKHIKDITKEDYIAFPKPLQIRKKNNLKIKIEGIPLTKEWGEFCGWYLAEGWIMGKKINGIGLACHSDEKEYLSTLISSLGLKFTYTQRTTNGGCFELSNSKLARNILKMFGKCDEKHIKDKIFLLERPFVIGLLRGLFLGDGCFKVRGTVTLVSTRLQLITQVKRLIMALRLGYPSIIDHGKSKIKNAKQAFIISFTGDTSVKFRKLIGIESEERFDFRKTGYSKYFKKSCNYYYAKVKEINDFDTPELVYDICLDKDPHSFCLISGVSSNSETAFYPNTEILNASTLVLGAEQQVMDGVGKIFRETTGNTDVDFFAEEYYRALEGHSEFKSRFLGWWLHKEYTKELPVGWVMPPEYKKIHDKYGATAGQCYWHWYKLTNSKDPQMFKREYPTDDTEAFIGDGTQYFDIMLTKYYMEFIKEPINSNLIYV